MDWVIWYSDGSSSTSEDPIKSHWGVICISEKSAEHGRIIWVGHDYYWLDQGAWTGGDFTGLLDHVTQPGNKTVLVGRAMPATRFHAVYKQALEDPRLPPKTSTDWCEAKTT